MGDFVEIRAVRGVEDEMRWYRKGTPRKARVKGERMESVDWACVFVIRYWPEEQSVSSCSHFQPCLRLLPMFPFWCRAAATATARRKGGSTGNRGPRSGHLLSSSQHSLSIEFHAIEPVSIPAASRDAPRAPKTSPPTFGASVVGAALIWMPLHCLQTFEGD